MIRVAVVGTGFIGTTHLEEWAAMEQAEITAVCTSTAEKGIVMSEKYHCSHYQNLDTLLETEAIDIVDICTPTFLHEANIMSACRRSVDIICEKPVTLTLDSMDRILEAVKAAGVKLMVGQVLRFWAEYDMIKTLYDQNRFGRIQSVYTHRLAQYPPGTCWRHTPLQSGGGLFDLTLHDVDYLIYLFGRVKTVYGAGLKSSTGCWDHVSAILTFENGINATIEGVLGMTEGYPFSTALRIIGENVTVDYDMSAGVNIENVNTARSSVILYENGKSPQELFPDSPTNFQAELAYFADCAENDKIPEKIKPIEARYSLEVLLAIETSLTTGQIVHLTENDKDNNITNSINNNGGL